MKKILKDCRGKIYGIVQNKDNYFFTGFAYEGQGNKKIDPYVMFIPEKEAVISSEMGRELNFDSNKFEKKEIVFTKSFRNYEEEVRKRCKGKNVEEYLQFAKNLSIG